MKPKHCKRNFLSLLKKFTVVMLVFVLMIWIIKYLESGKIVINKHLPRRDTGKYLVLSPKCEMLDMDPWDASIKEFVNPIDSYDCKQRTIKFTSVEKRENVGNVLVLHKEAELEYKIKKNHSVECCYSIVTRGDPQWENYTNSEIENVYDDTYSKSDCLPLKREIILSNTTEFVHVKCKQKNSTLLAYRGLHAIVPILPDVQQRLKNFAPSKKLNVLLLGIDSMSRLSLQRMMPYTANYFKQNQWIELKGYNKIADNTHPNLLAALTGRNGSDSLNRCTKFDANLKTCNLIWDEFKDEGYVTAFAEDTPEISTFNFQATGFDEKPTDYYLRPFFIAGRDLVRVSWHRSLGVCYGAESTIDHVLNYASNFAETFKNYNFFGLFWMNSYSHDDNNLARAMDSPFEKFLRKLEKMGVYENTVVVAFSDHGRRYGVMRKSFLGYYEEMLPFINIWVPPWFREKHPEKYKNLQINQNRLTTPYDFYLTLQDILNKNGQSAGCPKCASLFKEAPWSRSCEDASIDKEWCMCSNFNQLSLTDPLVVNLGQFLFAYVENKTTELIKRYNLNETICTKREFMNITGAFQSLPTTERGGKEYVITIQTQPNYATFQAKITVHKNHENVVSFISRLDEYKWVSRCVEQTELKRFCHCLANTFLKNNIKYKLRKP